jgi:murein DD-endopeptidase MepM/ murein hydrolase activator NlpD
LSRALSKGLVVAGLLALATGALAIGRPVPQRAAGELLVLEEPAAPAVQVRMDTVHSGEPLLAVLQRHGLGYEEAHRAIAGMSLIDARRVRAGTEVSAEVHPELGVQHVAFQLAIDRVVRLVRGEDDAWEEIEERLAWTVDTVLVAGVITSTLTEAIYQAAEAFPSGARREVAYGIAGALEYKVDMTRDLRVGDSVVALVERESTEKGHVRAGRMLATRAFLGGTRYEAIRFDDAEGREMYYDGQGNSMRAAFLRTPLEFSRISSVYGGRRHPILKTWRQHTGIDYAAATGTPVRTIGDGTVSFAGWKGGYGRTVEIRHKNGMVTRYAHLSAFGAGIKVGASVKVGNTIGRVGMTGMATGPHLHFETLINGAHRDPSVALRNVGGEPLPAAHRAAFAMRRGALLADLDMRVLALLEEPTDHRARSTDVRFGTGRPGDARAAGAAN